jgi:hypothetical protein
MDFGWTAQAVWVVLVVALIGAIVFFKRTRPPQA